MKRLVIFIASLFAVAAIYSQGEINSTRLTQTDLMGTARYMGMGGAFNALGGDATAIGNNPAGLGIYRSSELSMTLNLSVNNNKTSTATDNMKTNDWNFNINNFAFVANFESRKSRGLLSSNFAITYNQLKNFHSKRNMYTEYAHESSNSILTSLQNGMEAGDLYDIAQNEVYVIDANGNPYFNVNNYDNEMSIIEDGRLEEWNFAYGGNVNDFFYFGVGLGIRNLDYSMKTGYSEYYYEGDNQVGDFLLNNKLSTTATGFNFKFGAILRPVDFMRIGVAFQTPTFYTAEDSFDMSAYSYDTYEGGGDFGYNGQGYNGWYGYDVTTPLKLNTGLAFIIGDKGLISGDYEMEDYSAIEYEEVGLKDLNKSISNDLKIVHTVRVGAEYRIDKAFSVRAGYSLSTTPVKSDRTNMVTFGTDPSYIIPKNNSFYTLGFGYRADYFFIDLAYVLNQKKEDLYAHHMASPIESKSNISNIVCSFGWKF